MYISKKLESLLHFSKIKKMNNVKKVGSVHYDGYIDLLDYSSFLDGNVSIKERLYYIDHELVEYVKCYVCSAKAYWNDRGENKYSYNKYCSKCAKKSPEYRENFKTSMMNKYGVEHNWSSGKLRDKDLRDQVLKFGTGKEIENIDNIKSMFQLENIKDKSKTSMMNKYGVEHNWSSGKLRDKDLRDQVLKFGTCKEIENIDNITSPFDLDYIKYKSKSTNLERYGVEYYNNPTKVRSTKLYKFYNNLLERLGEDFTFITSRDEYIQNKLSVIEYKHKCGEIFKSHIQHIRCTKCNPYNKSIGENEVLAFCESLNIRSRSNLRSIIPPLELDVYLPDHNLAIEYNGVYWHSSDSVETENKDYHLHKTQECASKNIQLFHIFENEWLDPQKQIIWKSIITNRLGKSSRIFARKTEVRSVTSGDSREFLNSNHLQGSCVSSVNLGLYLDDRLVSIMTFGKSRYDKSMEWEMIRFCNEIGTSVVGGASKLLKSFRRESEGSIVSYADKRRSNGGLYERLGFSLRYESAPNYWYYRDPMVLESRIRYQKHKLVKLLEEYDADLTETQNMYNNGYRKIFDCGNQVWVLG